MIVVDQFSPGLEREYLIKGSQDKEVEAYYQFMVNMAVLLGAERERAEEEMKEALEFELKLAEFSLPEEERRNKTALYHPLTLAEVDELYPEVSLVSFIAAVTGLESVGLAAAEVVNVAVPQFVMKVRELLSSVHPRVTANYMIWRVVKSSVRYLGSEALKLSLQYSAVLTGKSKRSPRWEDCVKSTAGLAGKWSERLYRLPGSLRKVSKKVYLLIFFISSLQQCCRCYVRQEILPSRGQERCI